VCAQFWPTIQKSLRRRRRMFACTRILCNPGAPTRVSCRYSTTHLYPARLGPSCIICFFRSRVFSFHTVSYCTGSTTTSRIRTRIQHRRNSGCTFGYSLSFALSQRTCLYFPSPFLQSSVGGLLHTLPRRLFWSLSKHPYAALYVQVPSFGVALDT